MLTALAFALAGTGWADTGVGLTPVPCQFDGHNFVIATQDLAGRQHMMLIDSGSPVSYFRAGRRRDDGEPVALSFSIGSTQIQVSATRLRVAGWSQSERQGAAFEGTIGDDVLRNLTVAFDYAHGKLWMRAIAGADDEAGNAVFLNQSTGRSDADQVTIPLRVTAEGYFAMDGQIGGKNLGFCFDTGSPNVTLTTDQFSRVGVDPVKRVVLPIFTGMAPATIGVAQGVRLGSTDLGLQPIYKIPTLPLQEDGIVGPSDFASPLVIVDFAHLKVHFMRATDDEQMASTLSKLLPYPVACAHGEAVMKAMVIDGDPPTVLQEFGNDESMPAIDKVQIVGDGPVKSQNIVRDPEVEEIDGIPVRDIIPIVYRSDSGDAQAFSTLRHIFSEQSKTYRFVVSINGKRRSIEM